MLKTLGWTLLGLLGLVVVGVLSVVATGDEGLMGDIKQSMLEHSDAGTGYDDGALVWRQDEPTRITIEQLPTLEGRRRGTSWEGDPFLARMSWFGVSLRETIAHALELPPSRVFGDASLDGIWLDVDAARTHGLFDSAFDDWEPVRATILEAIERSYGLDVLVTEEALDVRTVHAGPGWAAHVEHGGGRSTLTRGDGRLALRNGHVAILLADLRSALGVELSEGLDTDLRYTFDLTWDPELPGALERALEEQLDLHLEEVVEVLEVARVDGVARPPDHLR